MFLTQHMLQIMTNEAIIENSANSSPPALPVALADRGRYWYFSMASVGTEGSEAHESGIETKMQSLLEAEGMHTTMWERIDVNKQVDPGNGEITLFKTAIVVHGLVRWGARMSHGGGKGWWGLNQH